MNRFITSNKHFFSFIQVRTLASKNIQTLQLKSKPFDFVSIKELLPNYKVFHENCNCYLNTLSEREKLVDPFAQLKTPNNDTKDPQSEIPIFKRHLLLLDFTSPKKKSHLDWLSKIEKDSNFPFNAVQIIKNKNMDLMKKNKSLPIMVNVVEMIDSKLETCDPSHYHVLSLPEWKVVSFNDASIKLAAEILNSEYPIGSITHPGIKISDYDSKDLMLICGHKQRDSRCSVIATEILTKRDLFKDISKYNIGIISHIGGHKVAGNVAVYLRPREKQQTTSVWLRHITPAAVDLVMGQLQKGIIVREFFRGLSIF
ncbi:hypothetical protein QEN19_003925 [Hanseniaspora menglaensis]